MPEFDWERHGLNPVLVVISHREEGAGEVVDRTVRVEPEQGWWSTPRVFVRGEPNDPREVQHRFQLCCLKERDAAVQALMAERPRNYCVRYEAAAWTQQEGVWVGKPFPFARRVTDAGLEDAAQQLRDIATPLLQSASIVQAVRDYLAAIERGLQSREERFPGSSLADARYAVVLVSDEVKAARFAIRAAIEDVPPVDDLQELGRRLAALADRLSQK